LKDPPQELNPFITGAPTDGTVAGFAALTAKELNEITDTTAKIPARAIFLIMGLFPCCSGF
jgi:hypothetical protein